MNNLKLPFDLSLLIQKTGTYRFKKNETWSDSFSFFIFFSFILFYEGRINLGFCQLILLSGRNLITYFAYIAFIFNSVSYL